MKEILCSICSHPIDKEKDIYVVMRNEITFAVHKPCIKSFINKNIILKNMIKLWGLEKYVYD